MVDGEPFTQALRVGETMTLPGGQGSVTFDGVSRFANFQIAHDISSYSFTALAKAGLAPPLINHTVTGVATWVLTAYFALGIVMNGISRSKPERLVMTPTVLVLTALYLILSLN